MNRRQDGFTIVEVLIAVIMLSIGVLALASSAGGVTRMMSSGKRKTQSFAMASSVIDSLRRIANSSCATLPSGGAGGSNGISSSWTVSNSGTTSISHVIEVRTSYPVGPYTKGDTLFATVYC